MSKKKWIVGLLSFLAFLCSSSWALDLGEAKQKGLVGERTDGYIGSVLSTPTPEVQKFIDTLNKERREKYLEISKSNGQSLETVEKLAVEKIKERLKEGDFFMNEKGEWQKIQK